MPAEIDAVSRRIMQLEIEQEALKRRRTAIRRNGWKPAEGAQ